MNEMAKSDKNLRAMNEALVLGSLRQHEHAEVVDNLNARLRAEIAERKRTEALLSCQKQAFEMVATGAPLIEVLEFLARATERQSSQQLLVAIHLLDESGARFEQTAAPSLPPEYSQAVNGMAVSSDTGSCCAALVQRRRVVVPDIAGSKEWPAFASLAVPLGLRAAWSTPIVSSSGKVLGTLVSYCRKVCEPDPRAESLDEIVTRTAAVVIERKAVEETLRESEARLQFSLDSAQVGDWDLNLITDTSRRSLRHDRAFGYTDPVQQWGFATFIQHVHPEDRADIEQQFRDAVRQQHDWHFECRIIWPDGSVHWIATHGSIYRTPEGLPNRMLGIVLDITERKQAELREQFLMQELAHRGQNQLAVIHAIVSRSLTGARPLAEAREVVMQRLHALARTQSVLTAGGFEAAAITEIVRLELEAFSEQVKAVGPDVMLNPKAAQTFALLLHELATNASKHGALSQPGGRIDMHWSIEGAGAEARFTFQWQERDGPPVAPPTRQGFGRTLLEKAAAQDFGAQPKINFAPDGLSYEIDTPLSVVAAASAVQWGGAAALERRNQIDSILSIITLIH